MRISKAILAAILVLSSGAGFKDKYDILESSLRGEGSNFQEGNRESIELALEKLREMRERLRVEKAEEEYNAGRLQRIRNALEPTTRKEAEPLLQKAQGVNRSNIKRLGELIKVSESEIHRLERRQGSIKPEGLDSGDFRLLPLPQSQ